MNRFGNCNNLGNGGLVNVEARIVYDGMPRSQIFIGKVLFCVFDTHLRVSFSPEFGFLQELSWMYEGTFIISDILNVHV
jgi:hypothetical protein